MGFSDRQLLALLGCSFLVTFLLHWDSMGYIYMYMLHICVSIYIYNIIYIIFYIYIYIYICILHLYIYMSMYIVHVNVILCNSSMLHPPGSRSVLEAGAFEPWVVSARDRSTWRSRGVSSFSEGWNFQWQYWGLIFNGTPILPLSIFNGWYLNANVQCQSICRWIVSVYHLIKSRHLKRDIIQCCSLSADCHMKSWQVPFAKCWSAAKAREAYKDICNSNCTRNGND